MIDQNLKKCIQGVHMEVLFLFVVPVLSERFMSSLGIYFFSSNGAGLHVISFKIEEREEHRG